MIERARKLNAIATFDTGSVLDPATLPNRSCDVTICGGVLAIFDDIDGPIENLLSTVKDGGTLYVSDTFNNHPIDVIMRYRRVGDAGEGDWESGWNVFSKISVERALLNTGRVENLSWHEFRIPFALERRANVMRTWTIETADNPHQIINGAAQILDVSVVQAKLKR